MADETETGLRMISALFDEQAEADRAVQALLDEGFDRNRIRVVPGNPNAEDMNSRPEAHRGFLEALADIFMPREDRHSYAEGLSRGGYLVTVTELDVPMHARAVEILDREGAVNLDEREIAWRSEGWSGRDDADDLNDAGRVSSTATGEVIPVVSEELQVGKRDVSLGHVRVRSYIRQEPVSEQVNLREERVSVERRPVDRPVGGTEDAFADKTIEAEERAEQPVVGKEARVIEEVSLHKEDLERQETVSDTVRRTAVEVEDERDRDASDTGTTDRK